MVPGDVMVGGALVETTVVVVPGVVWPFDVVVADALEQPNPPANRSIRVIIPVMTLSDFDIRNSFP